jgi:hypothetical protein
VVEAQILVADLILRQRVGNNLREDEDDARVENECFFKVTSLLGRHGFVEPAQK